MKSSEFKLSGFPWHPISSSSGPINSDGDDAQMILFKILEVPEQNGFELYASIDQHVGVSTSLNFSTSRSLVLILQKPGNDTLGSDTGHTLYFRRSRR